MTKWNLIIDVAECENCNNCVLASKDELVGNHHPGYSRPHPPEGTGVIRIERRTRGAAPMVDAAYLPRMCNHCDEAPCVEAGEASGAVRKREDGIVIIDAVKAKGRRDLVDACPYGAIVWNEVEQLPQHWFFDAHLLDGGWEAPRCVTVCPTRAIEAVKASDADIERRIQQEELRPLMPELGTRPRVYYKNLGRFDRLFIGGSVTVVRLGFIDCVEGASVELWAEGRVIGRTVTDAFGDFKFDGLSPTKDAYEVTVHHQQFGSASVSAELDYRSAFLGDIALQPQGAASQEE